jgi:hypothetical protein
MTSEPLDHVDREAPHFPHPFGGISVGVMFPERRLLLIALMHMGNGCGDNHYHNIAVQFDGETLWTTELGRECLSWIDDMENGYTIEEPPGEETHEVTYSER